MQTIPLVSVIVPAHNHDRFVAQALRSIAGQTYRQVELVIIDDGSTDRTAEVIARELTGFPFPYRFESQSNAGLPVTLNRAISLAQGEYLSFLASDDRYALDFIETNQLPARVADSRRPVRRHE